MTEHTSTKRTLDSRSSQTAAYTCLMRAFASQEPDPARRGPDELAMVFPPSLARLIARRAGLRAWFIRAFAPPGMYEYVLARTRLMDRACAQALTDGIRQVVVLGAGFDTRAWRLAHHNPAATFYELDHPATQRAKRDVLLKRGQDLPRALVWAPIDFQTENLGPVLTAAGLLPDWLSLFIWEGVSMYLSAEAVDATLAGLRQVAAPASRLVFDHVHAAVLRGEGRYYGEEGARRSVAKAGEPWLFGLEADAVGDFLAERGFRLTAYHQAAELEREFLADPDGAPWGRVNATHAIVQAEIRPIGF